MIIKCPHINETEHGYSTVEIINSYCECGLKCYDGCEYSFKKSEEKKANEAFDNFANIECFPSFLVKKFDD